MIPVACAVEGLQFEQGKIGVRGQVLERRRLRAATAGEQQNRYQNARACRFGHDSLYTERRLDRSVTVADR